MPASAPSARRRLRPADRARLIEQAATRLFAEGGYVSTSVDDIVAAAGVTKPMLYRHFESKQELCIRLLERYRDELVHAPLAELAADGPRPDQDVGRPQGPCPRQIERMIDAWLAWAETYPDATRLLFTPIRGDEEVVQVQRELYVQQRDTQAALLREFVPGLSRADAEPLAEITRAGFAAIALWWLDNPAQPRVAARQALVTMVHGILSTASGHLSERTWRNDAAQQDLV